jgi:hypothetical protein
MTELEAVHCLFWSRGGGTRLRYSLIELQHGMSRIGDVGGQCYRVPARGFFLGREVMTADVDGVARRASVSTKNWSESELSSWISSDETIIINKSHMINSSGDLIYDRPTQDLKRTGK